MNQSSYDNWLFRAVERGETEVVLELLRQGAHVDGPLGSEGDGYYEDLGEDFEGEEAYRYKAVEWTPLIAAVNRGFTSIAEILLDHGAQLEAAGFDGITALTCAIQTDRPEIARLLLQRGANVQVRQQDGQRPGQTLLHRATRKGHGVCFDLLLEYGLEIDVQDEEGLTPLHQAAALGLSEMVKRCIACGADVQARDSKGNTALSGALPSTWKEEENAAYAEVRTILREASIFPTFWEAIAIGDVPAGKYWISEGVDVNTPRWSDLTPLSYACSHGQAAFARMLLEQGAQVLEESEWDNPLQDAVNSGSEEAIELMLGARKWSSETLHHTLSACLYKRNIRLADRVAALIEDWESVRVRCRGFETVSAGVTLYMLNTGRADRNDHELIQMAMEDALGLLGGQYLGDADDVKALLDFGADCTNLLPLFVPDTYNEKIVNVLLQSGNAELIALVEQRMAAAGYVMGDG